MRPKKKKIQIPGIILILIFVVFVGLGVKGVGYAISYFKDKQPSNTTDKPKATKTVASYTFSLSGVMQSVENLSDCQVIAKRNLFEPLGGRRAEPIKAEPIVQREVKEAPPQPRPEPLNDIALTGIVHINNGYMALIEDSSNGKSSYLKKGDKLKNYVVESISEKAVTLTNGDSKLTQTLGSKTYYNIHGELLASGSANTQISANTTKQPSVKSDTPEEKDSNLSLIERMKARRRKELGQE